MNFYCEDIVNTDASGSVTGLGIEWTEGRPSTEWLALWLAYCGVIGAVLCLIMAGVRNDAGMVVLAGLSVMFTVAMVMWMRNYDGKHRALVFGRDGSITADEGLCGYTNIRGSLRYTLGDIRSIEAVRMKDKKPDEADSLLHGVKVIMRRGNVLYFAWNLDEDDALMVATRLNDAADAMRLEMANGANGGGGQAQPIRESARRSPQEVVWD